MKENTTKMLESVLKNHNIKTVYYIDRLKIYFDAYSKKENLISLYTDNNKNKFIFNSLPHHDYLDRKLELFQPSEKCLRKLMSPKIIQGDYAINYVELALDFVTDDEKKFKKLVEFFNRHLIYTGSTSKKSSPHYVDIKGETVYFSDKKKQKCLLLYHDKPSRKITGKFCLHLEYRLRGLNLLKQHDIYTIQNLVDFNHQEQWNQLLDFRTVNIQLLGKLCISDNTKSRQTYYNQGKKEFPDNEPLQKYISLHPEINVHDDDEYKSPFKKIKDSSFEQYLSTFLED